MLMDITNSEIAPGVVLVTLAGKIMMGTESERIVSLVEDLLKQGKRTVIFDLGGVTHIDSTGIGRFISSYNKLAAVDGEIRMANATGHVFQAFHVSLLDKVFQFYPTVEDASKA